MTGGGPWRRARELATNFTLMGTTALAHLGEDPLLLAIQTSRRLPRPLVAAVARVLTGLLPAAWPTRVLGAWLGGYDDVAVHLLEQTAASPGRRSRLLAELAVQLARPDLVPDLCLDPPAATSARAAWSRGDLSAAVGLAQEGGVRPLAARYRSEAAVLAPGARLAADASEVPNRPRPLAAFHVLTNSLPHTHSGYTARSQAVLAAQSAAGIRVEAATRLGYPVTVGRPAARHRDVVDGVVYRRVVQATWPSGTGSRLERQVDVLAPMVERFEPGVLHTTTHVPNGLVTEALARRLGVPWVYEVRGLLEETWVASRRTPAEREHAASSERYRLLRAKEAEVASTADAVVTLSRTLRDELVARGVAGSRITVVPNSVAPALLSALVAEPPVARQAVGLPVDGFWVGTVSSLVDYEGLDTLIDAIAELRARGVDARGCIVGDGVARPALERRARTAGVRRYVAFTGRVPRDRAVAYHRALDVFAVPRRDTRVCRLVTPLKPIEAMACGRPVLASDLPALAELVADDGEGARGGLVAAGDATAMADVLEQWSADEGVRAALGEAGRAFAAGRTWATAGTTYRSLYESLGAG